MNDKRAIVDNFLKYGSVLVVPSIVGYVRNSFQNRHLTFFEHYQSELDCYLFTSELVQNEDVKTE